MYRISFLLDWIVVTLPAYVGRGAKVGKRNCTSFWWPLGARGKSTFLKVLKTASKAKLK
ncbi:hypothetical protein HMPREF1862_00624 [Varibaculum cambriense]|uniref:Uncharacterized protein n=1 Tax=Varibaculum cambriense TaxID=184870 RepID=A0AB34X101_9ACTO|nr:hypothetical protein HMPREF1862_00624 [Varibaculum cambriense]